MQLSLHWRPLQNAAKLSRWRRQSLNDMKKSNVIGSAKKCSKRVLKSKSSPSDRKPTSSRASYVSNKTVTSSGWRKMRLSQSTRFTRQTSARVTLHLTTILCTPFSGFTRPKKLGRKSAISSTQF
jgi:hypothetical protein